uniref:Uncharacterized protein n=1 Tax=Anguilla anguilla TaxID=7936 RepID=A0A0E9TKZ2_ANGAN
MLHMCLDMCSVEFVLSSDPPQPLSGPVTGSIPLFNCLGTTDSMCNHPYPMWEKEELVN